MTTTEIKRILDLELSNQRAIKELHEAEANKKRCKQPNNGTI